MAYGIELFNEYSENLVRDGQCLYIKEAGACIKHVGNNETVLGAFPWRLGTAPIWYPSTVMANHGKFGLDYQWTNQSFFFAGTGFEATNAPNGNRVPVTGAADISDMTFFQVPPEGIMASFDFWYDLPPHAGRKVAGVATAYDPILNPASGFRTSLDYYVVSKDSPLIGAEQYGMQVFDENGILTYDSRAKNIRMVDYFVVSEADVNDVLMNGATKTYSLRAPVVSPYISTTLNWSARQDGDRFYHPKLTFDGVNFVLSPDQLKNKGPVGYSGGLTLLTRGFIVFVAEPET